VQAAFYQPFEVVVEDPRPLVGRQHPAEPLAMSSGGIVEGVMVGSEVVVESSKILSLNKSKPVMKKGETHPTVRE
jgi:hypothetical protein